MYSADLFCIAVITFSDNKADGCACKSEGLTDLIFDISLIGKMEKIRTVYKYHERGGLGGCLSHIVDLEPSALVGRGLNSCGGIGKHIIEHTCGYSHTVLRIYAVYKGVELVDSLSCFCGDENKGHVGHKAEFFLQVVGKLVHSV